MLIKKIKKKIDRILELRFNGRSNRKNSYQKYLRKIASFKGENYWKKIADDIVSAASSENENYFFHNFSVITHIAGEDSDLGYQFLDKIKKHPIGKDLLNKCHTPTWGSPFLLRKYPSICPTTASHLVNIISLYDAFGDIIKNITSYK